MFKQNFRKIGGVNLLSIRNENGAGIELIPDYGAVIYQMYLSENAVPVLDKFIDEKDIVDNPRYKQTLLFPFPNRLKDGRFADNGQVYQFPINESDHNNALHGLVYNKKFNIVELSLEKDKASLSLIYQYRGGYKYYPYPFNLTISYTITEQELGITLEVENVGNLDFPYGIGWHPYFRTTKPIGVAAPDSSLQEVNERMLPTGKESIYTFHDVPTPLTASLDNAFRLPDNENFNVKMTGFENIKLNFSADSSFRFFQIYTPANYITAIEPVTCNINALNTGDGLLWLAPGQTATHSCGLQLMA